MAIVWDKQSVLQRLGGNQALLETIVNIFLSQAEGEYHALKQAISVNDNTAIAQLSHKMKGNAADLGLSELRDTLASIEHAAKLGTTEVIASESDRLDKAFHASIECLHTP